MGRLLSLATALWNRRGVIVLSLIAFPALCLMYGLNKPPIYHAVQTLSLVPENAQSSLLQDVRNDEYQKILNRQMKSDTLIKAALNDVGVLLPGALPTEERIKIRELQQSLSLTAPGENIIEITLKHQDRSQILRLLEAVVLNFIDDIMAPERFAKEELSNSLANQVRTLITQQAESRESLHNTKLQIKKEPDADTRKDLEYQLASLDFQIQTLKMQIDLAEGEYQKALSATQQTMFHPIIKPESNPVIVSPAPGLTLQMFYLLLGLLLAIAFITITTVIGIIFDTSLRRDDEIRKELGLRILGRMPNLGDVSFDDGRISTMPNINI